MYNLKTVALMVAMGVFLMLTSFSDRPPKMKPEEFIRWVLSPASGLQEKITIDSYDYILSYLPAEFVALQELKVKSFRKKNFAQRCKELKASEYYVLMINLNDGRKSVLRSLSDDTKIDARQLTKYLAFDFQHSIQIMQGSDSIKCKFFHLEEMFETSSYIKLMIVFDRNAQVRKDRQLRLHLPWLDQGYLMFSLNEDRLRDMPKITIK